MIQRNAKVMEKFDSISHFLQTGKFNYRIFDMGRKVCEIPNEQFQQIESQELLYPYPFQQKAWLALLFWPEGKEHESVIWFLQFPIDELGYLKQQSRDAFLIDLLEQTGKNIQAKQAGDTVQDELSESSFAFKPREDRLAMFHALATVVLGHQPSQHYQYAHDYLLPKNEGGPGFEQWQFLGLQGIADVVARLQDDNNEALLAAAIGLMPAAPLQSYAHSLENRQFGKTLYNSVQSRLQQELGGDLISDAERGNNNVGLVASLIRALSSYPADQAKIELMRQVLESPMGAEIEVLAAISGRCWDDLKDKKLLSVFVEKLALQDDMAFNAILADLIMIPDMRELILDVMRSEKRSPALVQRFGGFMQVIGS
jgi:hypothetical protein